MLEGMQTDAAVPPPPPPPPGGPPPPLPASSHTIQLRFVSVQRVVQGDKSDSIVDDFWLGVAMGPDAAAALQAVQNPRDGDNAMARPL